MNKNTIDKRLESAMNAFFETPSEHRDFALTYTGYDTAVISKGIPFSEKAEKWAGFVREIFMFGPGTFYLFYSTLRAGFFFTPLSESIITHFCWRSF